jgi:glycosidase
LELATKETASKLTRIRKENLALIYGNFSTLQVNGKTYVFLRKYFDELAIVFFNKNDKEARFEILLPEWASPANLKSNFGNKFNYREGKIEMVLEPWSFEIISGSLE